MTLINHFDPTRVRRNAFPLSEALETGLEMNSVAMRVQEFSAFGMKRYAEALRRSAREPLPADVPRTRETDAATFWWRQLHEAGADSYFHPERLRPGVPLHTLIHPLETLERLLLITSQRPEFTPEDKRKLIAARLQCGADDVQTAVRLCLQSPSCGWMNTAEQTMAIDVLQPLIGDGTRHRVSQIWTALGGEQHAFRVMWDRFAREIADAVSTLAAYPVREEMREGKRGYRQLLGRLGIQAEPQNIHAAALAWWKKLEEVTNGVARVCGLSDWREWNVYDATNRTDGWAVVAEGSDFAHLYRGWVESARASFEDAGIAPERSPLDEIVYGVLDEDMSGQPPILSVLPITRMDDPTIQRRLQMLISPGKKGIPGQDIRRHHALSGRTAAARETWRALQQFHAARLCPSARSEPSILRMVPIEGSAFLAELVILLLRQRGQPWQWLAMLISWLKRLAQLIVEYEYHALGFRREKVVRNYMRFANIPPITAETEIAQMTFQLGVVSAPVLGAWGILSFAQRHCEGSVPRAMAAMSNTSACLVPANVLAYTLGYEDALGGLPLIPTSVIPADLVRQFVL